MSNHGSEAQLLRRDEIKGAGLKVTLPRMKILALLETSSRVHMSAEDVYRKLLDMDEDIGLATVYRVLTQFEGAGLVKRHHFDTGHSVFELEHGDHHDHLLCIKCSQVEEFVDEMIEKHQKSIAKQRGFVITDHSLVIYGICSSCQ
ncbi:MAG: ferric iron uptake transcriptional regulator [Gammaproteobacteria bacterium]|uniref:Ferric uptake regulation protein n=1 Tax=Candidatus Thiopontia autotrophica TaxID=2841688 RepID=A0A8J6P2J0_9GAMM|nr:ferric iron uptake transcriptional regulator [Candidatus Thiopontia autotrophica]MBL6969532.1 ferric iron uptake transcriptional regulator [Gammaproteobacteria bacterium]